MTRIYEQTSFEDIYALYKFDRDLRELTFKYLCEVEQKIRQLISYHFCNLYGEQQICYLTDRNSSPFIYGKPLWIKALRQLKI